MEASKRFDDEDVPEGELRDLSSTYECARCDEVFERTDAQVEDEDQSTEYCDNCLRLMADAERRSEGGFSEDDEEEDDEAVGKS